MPELVIYTDGGCRGNPGVGAWAFVLIHCASKTTLERADAVESTTNNQMELRAVIEALRAIKRPSEVLVFSDSKYVIQSARDWIPGWKERGWKKKSGELKNVDLLKLLDELLSNHKVEWRWVAGHSGEPGNERVDQLANEAMDRLLGSGSGAWEARGSWTHRLE
jgi:ribonuclease HI